MDDSGSEPKSNDPEHPDSPEGRGSRDGAAKGMVAEAGARGLGAGEDSDKYACGNQ